MGWSKNSLSKQNTRDELDDYDLGGFVEYLKT